MASIISCVAFVALTFNSFAHSVALDSTSPETLVDIAYGADPKQKMDVYLPANRSTEKTPVLFLIHGGGWNSGDKSQLTPYITALQKRLPEYAFVNINYRLFNFNTGNNRFPAQEDDVKNAVRFFREKASGYKVSPNIILLGASAGQIQKQYPRVVVHHTRKHREGNRICVMLPPGSFRVQQTFFPAARVGRS